MTDKEQLQEALARVDYLEGVVEALLEQRPVMVLVDGGGSYGGSN